MYRHHAFTAAVAALLFTQGAAQANDAPYSTGVDTDYPKRVFFGDLHLHIDSTKMYNLLQKLFSFENSATL